MGEFEGKVVIVTGGGQGIGFAIVKKFAENVKQTLIETKAEDLVRCPDIPGVSYFVRNKVGLELEKMINEGADAMTLNKYYMQNGGNGHPHDVQYHASGPERSVFWERSPVTGTGINPSHS